MKFIRFGNRGINLASVRDWRVSQGEDVTGNGMASLPVPGDQTHDVVNLIFVTGEHETFTGEEAVILRRWLEGNAEDISVWRSSSELQTGS